MSFPNPRYDPSRRRRRHRPPAAHHSPLTSLATTAAIAYGAYRLGSWAWNAYFDFGDDDTDKDHENEDGNLLYEWTKDYRTVQRDIRQEEGFDLDDFESEVDETSDADGDEDSSSPRTRMRRSRRSRVDCSDGHNTRSHRPSPPQDYHRHNGSNENIEEGGEEGYIGEVEGDDGLVKSGMKKAAAGLGSAVTAGISAGIQAYSQNSQGDASNPLPEQERRLRMGRCRLETSRAMMDFLPTLKNSIAKETDLSAETEELKKLRTRKKEILEMKQNGDNEDSETNQIIGEEVTDEEDAIRERERCLWNDIKNKSVTRLVTTIYAHTIIFLVLTVQVNLLGGRLLREEMEEQEEGQKSTTTSAANRYRASHQTVLAKTYHYLFSKGIPSLAESVAKEVEEILQKWDVLGDDASLRDVSTWMESVRDKIEQRRQKAGIMSQLVKFVIPPEGEIADAETNSDTTTTDDELAKYILDETYDLLESPTFANAERQCLDTTFDQLRIKVLGKLFLLEDQIPLANVVTHLQKAAVSTFHKPPSHKEEMKSWGGVLGMMEEPLPSVLPNDYISKLERLDAVQELSDVCF